MILFYYSIDISFNVSTCEKGTGFRDQNFNSCFRLLKKFDFPAMAFSLYFLGYEDESEIPEDETERAKWVFTRRATLELTQ